MQNCPLKATHITSVMVFNTQNCKIYGAMPWILPWTPSYKSAYPADERLCH